jgi:hypothetical protein
MPYCVKCGNELQAGVRFCEKCGAAQDVGVPEAAAQAPAAPAAPPAPAAPVPPAAPQAYQQPAQQPAPYAQPAYPPQPPIQSQQVQMYLSAMSLGDKIVAIASLVMFVVGWIPVDEFSLVGTSFNLDFLRGLLFLAQPVGLIALAFLRTSHVGNRTVLAVAQAAVGGAAAGLLPYVVGGGSEWTMWFWIFGGIAAIVGGIFNAKEPASL